MQQLVKLKGSGGTRRFEVLVRDAHADNEFGVAPDRVLQDVHDPSANSDLDRIVVEQLVIWIGDNRAVWESDPASFSVNVGMGTIADPKFASFVAARAQESQGAGQGASASRSPRSPASSRCATWTCSSRPARRSAATWCSTTSRCITTRCGG